MMGKKVEDVRIVPGGVEDITVGWCDEVLHQGGCIHQDVAVTKVQAERLTSDSTGMEDGGGLSEAVMIRIQVHYRLLFAIQQLKSFYCIVPVVMLLVENPNLWLPRSLEFTTANSLYYGGFFSIVMEEKM